MVPVILVVSCARFDRGSQLYSWRAKNVRLTKPTALMSFDKPYLRGFQCLPTQNVCLFEGLNWDFENFKTKVVFVFGATEPLVGQPTYLNFIENQVGIVLPYQGVI